MAVPCPQLKTEVEVLRSGSTPSSFSHPPPRRELANLTASSSDSHANANAASNLSSLHKPSASHMPLGAHRGGSSGLMDVTKGLPEGPKQASFGHSLTRDKENVAGKAEGGEGFCRGCNHRWYRVKLERSGQLILVA